MDFFIGLIVGVVGCYAYTQYKKPRWSDKEQQAYLEYLKQETKPQND